MCVYMLETVVPVQVTAGVKVTRLETLHHEAREAGEGARAGRWDQHSKELGCLILQIMGSP